VQGPGQSRDGESATALPCHGRHDEAVLRFAWHPSRDEDLVIVLV